MMMMISGADFMGARGHVSPTFTNGWARGAPWVEETGQTVLTITKALTKTTNCAFRAKKWRGTIKKIFSGALRRIGAPHFQIRSGASDDDDDIRLFLLDDLDREAHAVIEQRAKRTRVEPATCWPRGIGPTFGEQSHLMRKYVTPRRRIMSCACNSTHNTTINKRGLCPFTT